MVKQNADVPEEQITEEQPAPEPITQESLMAELQTAMGAGDFKAVAQVSRKIDTMQRAAEKSELDAKRAALDGLADIIKTAYALLLRIKATAEETITIPQRSKYRLLESNTVGSLDRRV